MVRIEYPDTEMWDESRNCFLIVPAGEVYLEHSLVAMSKWESKYHKPFLSTADKTHDELRYYIRCMGLSLKHDEILDDEVASLLVSSDKYISIIKSYLEDPMTATTVKNDGKKGPSKVITSEVIYSWLVAHQIDFSVQYWPLPRLIKLVEVCNANNQPSKKMGKAGTMNYHRAMNAARRPKKP